MPSSNNTAVMRGCVHDEMMAATVHEDGDLAATTDDALLDRTDIDEELSLRSPVSESCWRIGSATPASAPLVNH